MRGSIVSPNLNASRQPQGKAQKLKGGGSVALGGDVKWIEKQRQGLCGVLLRVDNLTPITLKRVEVELKHGVWDREPPAEIHEDATEMFGAQAGGHLGRHGVRGKLAFSATWGGQETKLYIVFENPIFGARRLNCYERPVIGKDSGKDPQKLLVLSSTKIEKPNSSMDVVLELSPYAISLQAPPELPPQGSFVFTSVPTDRNPGLWQASLLKADRSVLFRVVNLTQRALALVDMEITVDGVWAKRPEPIIDGDDMCEFGVASTGFMAGTQGQIVYVIETPRDAAEEAARIKITWQNQWVGKRVVSSEDTGSVFVVSAHMNPSYNLSAAVHIIDPTRVPRLELLQARAVSSSKCDQPLHGTEVPEGAGEDVFAHVYKMCTPNDVRLNISARSFLSSLYKKGIDPGSSLWVQYRIGPEVFARLFGPNENVHLSAAVAGGEDNANVVLSAKASHDSHDIGSSGYQKGGSQDIPDDDGDMKCTQRALRVQRILVEAVWPSVRDKMDVAFGKNWMSDLPPSSPLTQMDLGFSVHLWEPIGSRRGLASFSPASTTNVIQDNSPNKPPQRSTVSSPALSNFSIPSPSKSPSSNSSPSRLDHLLPPGIMDELDFEGLIAVLKGHWQVFSYLGITAEDALPPLEKLVSAWGEQTELDDKLVDQAAASVAVLCEKFGRSSAAMQAESLSSAPARRQKTIRRSQIAN